MAFNFEAYVRYLGGDKVGAKEKFEIADRILVKDVPSTPVQLPTISAYYCKFLLDSGDIDAALERALKTQAWREAKTWQVAIDTTSLLASDLIVLGLIFLERGDLVNAELYLEKEVELLKSADEWLYLPSGLNARSRYYIAISNFDAASIDLLLAADISVRTGAKFSEWETYLNLSLLYIAKSDIESARLYLEKAMTLEGMSDYRYRDVEIEAIQIQLDSLTA